MQLTPDAIKPGGSGCSFWKPLAAPPGKQGGRSDLSCVICRLGAPCVPGDLLAFALIADNLMPVSVGARR